MLALVWLAYASFGLVSNSVAPLVTQIVADLGISYGQMGTILGAWQLTYILVAYTAGRIVDRVGLRRALGAGLFVIALSGILRGMAVDYWTMFLAVGLFGFGGPMVSIGAPKLIATWFQGPERGTAAGIYTTGPAIGSVLALATANSVLMPLTGSWRTTVVAYGGVALVACLVWWLVAVDRAGRPRAAGEGDMGRLLRIRNVWLVLTIGFAAFLASHALSTWLPRVLQWHGYDPVSAGYWAAIPNLVGILGALTLPRLIPARLRTRALMLQFLAAAAALSLIGLTEGAPLIAALFLQGFVYSSITPFLMLVMMETPAVGAAAMGAAGGLYFTVGEVGGFSGPSAMGILFDLTGGFALGLVGVAGLMVVMGLACLKLERSG